MRPPHRGCDKLKDKVALVTGGDSGIGRSVAAMFALEGADVAIVYLPKEEEDAQSTKELVNKKTGRSCLLLPYDLSVEANCKTVVEKTIEEYGNIDILVCARASSCIQRATSTPPSRSTTLRCKTLVT